MDLNVHLAFDALMAERSVTRAGQHIGLGQPDMSAALARLRTTFGDKLFVKIPGQTVGRRGTYSIPVRRHTNPLLAFSRIGSTA